MIRIVRSLARAGAAGVVGTALLLTSAFAQESRPASSETPSWVVPELLAAARAEGGLTVYSSMNEQEGLPLWKMFEDATGIHVAYVRSSDTSLMGRIAIERRAQQRSWDVLNTTAVVKLPPDFLQPFDPPEAKNIIPQARDPKRLWYGVYANYNSPAYNTKFVKPSDLPKTYEEFVTRKDWAGKIAIDGSDTQWLSAIFAHYGDEKARRLIKDIVSTLNPVIVDGHLALARSVAAGEYWVALNNYVSLTLNTQLAGAPTDIWALDPVALFFGQVGINSQAPHPKTALLAANFMLSREAQQFMTRAGRMPVRPDVAPNPPDAIQRLETHKVINVVFSPEQEKTWDKTFKELFKSR